MDSQKYIIIDDALSPFYLDRLERLLESGTIEWFHNDKSVNDRSKKLFCKDSNTSESTLMAHLFSTLEGVESPHFDQLKPIFDVIQKRLQLPKLQIMRSKANLTFPLPDGKSGIYSTPHIDSPNEDFFTAVMYPTDCDGDTKLFSKKDEQSDKFDVLDSIAPKKGRIVVFDGHIMHAACFPQEHDHRIIINMVFRGRMDGK